MIPSSEKRAPLYAVLGAALLAACAEHPPAKPAPPTATCFDAVASLRQIGPDARTVSFVLFVDRPSCASHPAPRVLQLDVDGKVVRTVEIPCVGSADGGAVEIEAPARGIAVEPFVVDEGQHAFRVVDPVSHDEDVEHATIPHVELEGNAFFVGNEFEVVEMNGVLRVRGPVAFRVPRL